jgi:MoxR-like ATPase
MKHLDIAQRLEQSVISIIKGHEKNIRNILACMISGGHVLLEDNPLALLRGMKKTYATFWPA